jgi:hypothetical protein
MAPGAGVQANVFQGPRDIDSGDCTMIFEHIRFDSADEYGSFKTDRFSPGGHEAA